MRLWERLLRVNALMGDGRGGGVAGAVAAPAPAPAPASARGKRDPWAVLDVLEGGSTPGLPLEEKRDNARPAARGGSRHPWTRLRHGDFSAQAGSLGRGRTAPEDDAAGAAALPVVPRVKTDAEAATFIAQRFRGEHAPRPRRGKARGAGDRALTDEALTTAAVRQAVERLRAEGCAVGVKTHNAALSVFSRASWAPACLDWFQKVPPAARDVQTYNNVLLALAKASDVAQHRRFWNELVASRRTPTSHSYLTKLVCMAKDGRRHGLRDIGAVLQAAAPANTHLINAAINAAASADDAVKIYRQLAKQDLEPDRFTLLAVLGKCQGDGAAAETLFAECVPPKGRVVPTIREWTALLAAHRDSGDMQALRGVWARLSSAVRPNEVAYATFIKGCIPAAAVRDAEGAYEAARHGDEAKQHHIHTNMMQVYAAAGDRDGADRVWGIVQGSPLAPSGPLRDAYARAQGAGKPH